jgi:hypothetical protein
LNTRISIKMENFLTTFLSYYESFNEDPAPWNVVRLAEKLSVSQ